MYFIPKEPNNSQILRKCGKNLILSMRCLEIKIAKSGTLLLE